MTSNKQYGIIAALIILGSVLTSCALFSSQKEPEGSSSPAEVYARPTQEKVIRLPSATSEKVEHSPEFTPTHQASTTPTEIPATPTAESSATPDAATAENCPIILVEGTINGLSASHSRTWVEAINNLQTSQAAPLTIPVSENIDDLCALDGSVRVYLGWQDNNRLVDHGEMSTTDASALLRGSSGQPAILIP